MSDFSVRVENVGKSYRLWNSPADSLLSLMVRGVGYCVPPISGACERFQKSHFREFVALREVSFAIRRGEAVGIIGKNGSGKSTLLQIIAGTLLPDTGRVSVGGRVAALLELGSGFNPEFSGLENIYLNASILGMSHQECEAKLEEIIDFSEIREFIDQPVKTYSSGMVVRLAFAVQAVVEPDVLIVDEALAVGDVFFQLKCHRRMEQLLSRGTSVILASHDSSSIAKYCTKALYLDAGVPAYFGDVKEALHRYLTKGRIAQSALEGRIRVQGDSLVVRGLPADRYKFIAHSEGYVRVVSFDVTYLDGSSLSHVQAHDSLKVSLEYEALADLENPIFTVRLVDSRNINVHSKNTLQEGVFEVQRVKIGSRIRYEKTLDVSVGEGDYVLALGLNILPGIKNASSLTNTEYQQCRVVIADIEFGPLAVRHREQMPLFYGMADLAGVAVVTVED